MTTLSGEQYLLIAVSVLASVVVVLWQITRLYIRHLETLLKQARQENMELREQLTKLHRELNERKNEIFELRHMNPDS